MVDIQGWPPPLLSLNMLFILSCYIPHLMEMAGRDHERFLSKFRRFDLQIEL